MNSLKNCSNKEDKDLKKAWIFSVLSAQWILSLYVPFIPSTILFTLLNPELPQKSILLRKAIFSISFNVIAIIIIFLSLYYGRKEKSKKLFLMQSLLLCGLAIEILVWLFIFGVFRF